MATRKELIAAIRGRYKNSALNDRTRILDEFVAITGYHCKHAIRVLSGKIPLMPPKLPRKPRRYWTARVFG